MKKFLAQVAEDILEEYELPREEINLLFPNYRAALFLQRELATQSDAPIWSPGMYTMDRLVEEHSKAIRADDLTLIYQLFKSWRTLVDTEEKETFNRFFFWGKSLLSDFDEVDKYRIDAKRLFHQIRDLRELEARFDSSELLKELSPLWESLLEEHSRTKEAFLDIWNNLYAVYSDLQARLEEESIAYSGMLYRELADHPQRLNSFCDQPIVIAGFNRLNRCEEIILSYLKEHAEVRFYWDTDPYLTEFLEEDAGRYLKKNIRTFPPALPVESQMSRKEKKITIRGVPLLAGQSQWVRKSLQDWNAGEETAVIIPDEQLLIPVLSAWPEEVDELNISMGLPIRETPVFSLVEAFLSLHDSYRNNGDQYYYRWIDALLNHPYLPAAEEIVNRELVEAGSDKWNILRKNIYLKASDLPKSDGLSGILFKPLEGSYEFFDRLLGLMQYAYEQFEQEDGDESFIREILVHSHGRIMRLRDIVREADMTLSPDAILPLITELFRLTRIPFKGEPLRGTQVLGPLEARSLDFQRIVIPAMNEGTFPPSTGESFLPYSLRKAFQLPTSDDHAAEYSYYFWSILQRAEDIVLLYNTESGDMGQQERSRFLQQLMYLKNDNWIVQDEIAALSVLTGEIPPFSISGSSTELQEVNRYLSQGVSPSALDTYLNCRLRFYLEHVLGWKEKDETLETVDAAMIGRLLHRSMELIYGKMKSNGKTIEAKDIESLESTIGETVERAIADLTEFSGDLLEQGLAMVYRDILERYVREILKYDKSQAPLRIFAHEKRLKNIPLPRPDAGQSPVGIKGIVDRVDEHDGTIRVIDYKTGSVKLNISSISNLFDRTRNNRNSAAMQTMLYTLALSETPEFKDRTLIPGMYSVRSITDESMDGPAHEFTLNHQPFRFEQEERDAFLGYFYDLIDEIKDPEQPFDQTDNWNRCQYCPFIHFCGREEA